MSEVELDQAIGDMLEQIDSVGCDTAKFSVVDSIDFYAAIKDHCNMWIQTLESEL